MNKKQMTILKVLYVFAIIIGMAVSFIYGIMGAFYALAASLFMTLIFHDKRKMIDDIGIVFIILCVIQITRYHTLIGICIYLAWLFVTPFMMEATCRNISMYMFLSGLSVFIWCNLPVLMMYFPKLSLSEENVGTVYGFVTESICIVAFWKFFHIMDCKVKQVILKKTAVAAAILLIIRVILHVISGQNEALCYAFAAVILSVYIIRIKAER